MSINVFEHPWLSGLFGDAEISAIWAADAQLAHMLAFEAAWSRARGACGLSDAQEAEATAQAIESTTIDGDDLRRGTGIDGLPIPALVKQLKAIAGTKDVHLGATSQDVIDTALAITLLKSLDLFKSRLEEIVGQLAQLEQRFGDQAMMGRTRMQAALPITVNDRIETWRLPLQGYLKRIELLRPNIGVVQVGGAVGNRAALGDHSECIVASVAKALDLNVSDRAWHVMRDTVVEAATLFSLISGSLGKLGQDITLMAQQGVGEITLSGSGGSSAMPHKQNPILAETLVSLARYNATQVAGVHQAMVHEQERSGTAWMLEWLTVPQMALATGSSLLLTKKLLASVERIGEAG